MKNLTLLAFVFFVLILSSCSKNPVFDSENYLVFGHFYGECLGEGCVETFALTSDELFEDTNDNYRGTNFNFVKLSQEKFNLVTGLEDSFPEELLSASEDVFGCPDCGDWGGFYVEYVQDGIQQAWFIDTQLESIPSYLHEFAEEIREKISLINQ